MSNHIFIYLLLLFSSSYSGNYLRQAWYKMDNRRTFLHETIEFKANFFINKG